VAKKVGCRAPALVGVVKEMNSLMMQPMFELKIEGFVRSLTSKPEKLS